MGIGLDTRELKFPEVLSIDEFNYCKNDGLAPTDDHAGLAEGVARLIDAPEMFLAMSQAAAQRVRGLSSKRHIIEEALKLIQGK